MQDLLKLNGTSGKISAANIELLAMYIIAEKSSTTYTLDVLRDYTIHPDSGSHASGITVYDYQGKGNGGVRNSFRAQKLLAPLAGSSGTFTFTQAGLDECKVLLASL